MQYAHIVAASMNNIIGRNGAMPWHIKEDLQRFKATTMGHPMLMGRKTFDSLGRVLPGRPHIVISRSMHPQPGVDVVASLEEARQLCEQRCGDWGEKVFIIGGGQIYQQTLTWVSEVYLTRIHEVFAGDTAYPTLDEADWSRVGQEQHLENTPPFSFELWQRQQPKQD